MLLINTRDAAFLKTLLSSSIKKKDNVLVSRLFELCLTFSSFTIETLFSETACLLTEHSVRQVQKARRKIILKIPISLILIETLRKDDELVVWDIDRLGRTTLELIILVDKIK
jgi:hypothetical protein